MKTILMILALSAALVATAQNPINSFTLTDVVTGKTVSLDQFSSSLALTIIFTSNACPYDVHYADRLNELITTYSGKIPFLLINAHPDPEETPELMKVTATGWAYSVPYLSDKDQLAMDALDAKRSPEAFLLTHVNGAFVVSYSGAIDDSPQEPAAVTVRYLKDAIDALLAGKSTVATTVRAAGCSIRKK